MTLLQPVMVQKEIRVLGFIFCMCTVEKLMK